MISHLRRFHRVLSIGLALCTIGVSASAQFNAAPYDNGAYAQSQLYPQQPPTSKPSIAAALSALGIGGNTAQTNQAVQYGQTYGQKKALWMAEPSDTSMFAMISRWTGLQRRSAHWLIPFDPQVQNYAQLNQELNLQNATNLGQAVERLVQSYNRRANDNSKIAACLYNDGQVAAVFFLMADPRAC